MAAPMRQNTARDRSCETNLKEEEASPGGPADDYDGDDDDDDDGHHHDGLNVLRCRADILGTNCKMARPVDLHNLSGTATRGNSAAHFKMQNHSGGDSVRWCFTPTETVRTDY